MHLHPVMARLPCIRLAPEQVMIQMIFLHEVVVKMHFRKLQPLSGAHVQLPRRPFIIVRCLRGLLLLPARSLINRHFLGYGGYCFIFTLITECYTAI